MLKSVLVLLSLTLLFGCGGDEPQLDSQAIGPRPLPLSPRPLKPVAGQVVSTKGALVLSWTGQTDGATYEWELHTLGGDKYASARTRRRMATVTIPAGWSRSWAWRVRAIENGRASPWTPFVVFSTRWQKPPKLRGWAWWNPTDGPRNQAAFWSKIKRTSNVISLKFRDWYHNRAGAMAQIRRIKAEGWPEVRLVTPTLWITPGGPRPIEAIMKFVLFVRDQGLYFEFMMIGDEPPIFSGRDIAKRNWVYDQLRRRLNAAGLAHVKMYYDWYPWGVKGEGGGDWEKTVERWGWPKEDAHANHAGYGVSTDLAVKRVNYFALRWLKDRGWPDVPVIVTPQCFSTDPGKAPLKWSWHEERLKAYFRMPYGGALLDERAWRRLTLITPFAMGRARDTRQTAKDVPEVLKGYERLTAIYGLKVK